MSKDKPKEIAEIWNSVREDDDAEYAAADPDFRAKLGHAAAEVRQGRSTGIAGLEKFEQAVAKDAGVTVADSGVDAARVAGSEQPTVFDAQAREAQAAAGAEAGAELTEKGMGAQVGGKEKALKDAAGASKKVESDDVNSPSYPSAARPLAAEVPGNKPEKKAAAKKTATKAKTKKAGK